MHRSNRIVKKDFIGKPAPPGYIAGVGRGATGFTTRSDLGPAREPSHQFAGSRGAGPSGANARDNDQDEESEYLNEANYDEFSGYKGSLFNNEDPYDDDDKEADKIYEAFDLHMRERGKALEKKQALQLEAFRFKRPKIQNQFKDLMEDLKQVSEADWFNLPESGDARNRKQRVGKIDKYTPIPESLLVEQNRLAKGGETLISIDPRSADHPDMIVDQDEDGDNQSVILENRLAILNNNLQNKAADSGKLVNIGDMNECRSSIISTTLSRASNSVGLGQLTATNHEAYLGQLASSNQVKVTENLDERRKQYVMMLKTNLNVVEKSKVYLMYIDLEEKAGKLSNARALARKACEECPKCVDLWCESIRLHRPEKAKQLMIDAIKANSSSLKLWLKAAELENLQTNKLKVFQKAKEFVSSQPEFWRNWAETETLEKSKRKILKDALDEKHCPNAIDLWLSLARLKPNLRRALKVLDRARKHNPNDRSIPIEVARLLEKANKLGAIKVHIDETIDEFASSQLDLNRDDWFKEAIQAEREGYPETGAAIVSRLHRWDLGHLERDYNKLLDKLLEDAKNFVIQDCPRCARQTYRSTVEMFHGKANQQVREQAWIAWAKFEQTSENLDELEKVLDAATSSPDTCQTSESLWLMLIDLKKDNHNDEVFKIALEKNPCSEKIILAVVEIYWNRNAVEDARRILVDARNAAESAHLLKRHAELERSLGKLDEAVRLLKIGVDKYRDNPEFFLTLGHIEEQRGNYKLAANQYQFGLTSCKTSVDLWISLARLRERTEGIPKARTTFLNAKKAINDKIATLYIESARLEIRAFLDSTKGTPGSITKRPNLAEFIVAEGLRECKGQPEIATLELMQRLIKERKFAQCI